MYGNKLDYSKTVIYKLVCNNKDIKDFYIDHTTDIISRRWSHERNITDEKNQYYDRYQNQFIRNNGGWENWKLIKIENYPCNNKYEANKRCRVLVDKLNATINKKIVENFKIKKMSEKMP
jgi:hypothetical protein